MMAMSLHRVLTHLSIFVSVVHVHVVPDHAPKTRNTFLDPGRRRQPHVPIRSAPKLSTKCSDSGCNRQNHSPSTQNTHCISDRAATKSNNRIRSTAPNAQSTLVGLCRGCHKHALHRHQRRQRRSMFYSGSIPTIVTIEH